MSQMPSRTTKWSAVVDEAMREAVQSLERKHKEARLAEAKVIADWERESKGRTK